MQKTIKRIRNAKLINLKNTHDIFIENGCVTEIVPSDILRDENRPENFPTDNTEAILDAKNKLVLPGLIDAHTHIDKSFSPVANKNGDLHGAIAAMQHYKSTRSQDDVIRKAEKSIRSALANGVSLLRSHLDLANEQDLELISDIIQLKQKFRQAIDIEFTILGSTDNEANTNLMRKAFELGADMIGGAPSLTKDPRASVSNAVKLAKDLNAGLDLHIDEKQDTNVLSLKFLAEECLAQNTSIPVIASHCVSLAYLDKQALQGLMDLLVESNISIVSLPICNLTLMGRDEQPATRGIAPIKALLNRGINVAVASDNVQDPFNPFGNYDPLLALNIACLGGHMSSEDELQNAINLVTSNPAEMFNYAGARIEPGAPASMCVTASDSLQQSVIDPPIRLATIKNGDLVFKKNVEETWYF